MKKSQSAKETRDLNVEVDEEIKRRLKLYVAANEKLTIKIVVNAALDAYLPALDGPPRKRRGA